MAILIKSNGDMEKNISLQTLTDRQSAVGGYIEYVYLRDGGALIVNEEGRVHGLPHNSLASDLAQKIIVGNVILLSQKELKDE